MSKLVSLLNSILAATIVGWVLVCAASPRPPKPLPNDSKFLAQIEGSEIVLVKFGADWCPPCRQMEAELKQLSASATEVSVVKLDVDHNRELAKHYGVTSIPHVILFKHGQQVDQLTGFRTHQQLEAWIKTTK